MDGPNTPKPAWRRLRLRYPATCTKCDLALSRGTEAWYSPGKKIFCLACGPTDAPPDPGAAGASAAAEGERRRDRRVDRVRKQYGDYAADVARKMASDDIERS